jgi:hypothetical protein
MVKDDAFYLIMELTEGHYGEPGSVFDVHLMGYAEFCEKFNEKFDSPWFCETFGIIPDDKIKLIRLEESGDLICEISDHEYGVISHEFWCESHRFIESLTDEYAYRLGFLNGIDEFNGEIELETLRMLLIEDSLVLHRPFEQYGYFEKLSTVEESKGILKKILSNNK